MKTYPPIVRQPPRHIRVPAFIPVPLRARADGWTPERQAAFLGALAETGSVGEAARRVGMAREGAYRLRARVEAASFAAAWDAVTGRSKGPRRKVTSGEIAQAAIHGRLKPIIFAGKHVATARKPDSSALLRHLAQLDRAGPLSWRENGRSQSFDGRSGSTSPSDRRLTRRGR